MFLLPQDYWEVRKVKKMGKGVFATKDIPAGQVIGDYLGTVINAVDEDSYEAKYGFYVMYYNDYKSIVPDLDRNGVHLVNHSCEPNAAFYTYKGHTIYFTLRKIFKGEEITTSYQLSPLDKEECGKKCIHDCYCKSPLCTKTWHMPKDKYKKWDAFDNKITKKTKKERVFAGKNITPLKKYPKTIPDYAIYDLSGSNIQKPVIYADKILPKIREIRERIRETGRYATFANIGLTVYKVSDNDLITNRN